MILTWGFVNKLEHEFVIVAPIMWSVIWARSQLFNFYIKCWVVVLSFYTIKHGLLIMDVGFKYSWHLWVMHILSCVSRDQMMINGLDDQTVGTIVAELRPFGKPGVKDHITNSLLWITFYENQNFLLKFEVLVVFDF